MQQDVKPVQPMEKKFFTTELPIPLSSAATDTQL
jgi:hypothetical protein